MVLIQFDNDMPIFNFIIQRVSNAMCLLGVEADGDNCYLTNINYSR